MNFTLRGEGLIKSILGLLNGLYYMANVSPITIPINKCLIWNYKWFPLWKRKHALKIEK